MPTTKSPTCDRLLTSVFFSSSFFVSFSSFAGQGFLLLWLPLHFSYPEPRDYRVNQQPRPPLALFPYLLAFSYFGELLHKRFAIY